MISRQHNDTQPHLLKAANRRWAIRFNTIGKGHKAKQCFTPGEKERRFAFVGEAGCQLFELLFQRTPGEVRPLSILLMELPLKKALLP